MIKMKNVPNILTLFRIALIPIIIIIVPINLVWSNLAAVTIFAIGSITDGLDGYIARKYNAVTLLGKLLDPIADKMYICAALVLLVAVGRIAPWVVILILAREFAIAGLRQLASEEKISIPVDSLGKWKAALQMLGIGGLLIWETYFGVSFSMLGRILIWVSLVLSLISATQYFRNYFRLQTES